MVFLKMADISYIMSLLDWNNSLDKQEYGKNLARDICDLRPFLQPCNKDYNKNVWDNCATILSEKTDEELSPYLNKLLEWIQDLNWPGAFCILDRLKEYKDENSYNCAYNYSLNLAKAQKDTIWEENLQMLSNERNAKTGQKQLKKH